MKELVKKLNQAAETYYSGTGELMSDKEYDKLYDRLKEMEEETGIVLPDSPTLRVGFQPVSSLEKVQHEVPALSLDKTKSVDDLGVWLKNQEGILSWKMDGLTLCLTYENGRLVRAVTRGDGRIGEDVTHNTGVISGIPLTIPVKEKLLVRGETVISYQDFETINEEVVRSGKEPYKNPRNLVSGSIRLLDPKEAERRKMQFYLFSAVREDGQWDKVLYEMEKLGFRTVQHTTVTERNLALFIDVWRRRIERGDVPFPTDGLVLTYNDIAYGLSLGTTGKFPKHSIAFKWQDETAETVLRRIDWSASASGLINPVAEFDPVELEGTTVTRASVHNLRIMQQLGLGIGDHVLVYKANMIIPQIDRCIEKSGNIPIPEACPVCHMPTERRESEDGNSEFLYCVNPVCTAKQLGRFKRFVSRDGLNIVGLAENTLLALINKGILKEPADILMLPLHPEYEEIIVSMEGFGEKSWKNLIRSIRKAQDTTFAQYYYALGIPGSGHEDAKLLSAEAEKAGLEKTEFLFRIVRDREGKEKLSAIHGIGEKTAKEIISWWAGHGGEAESMAYLHLNIQDNKPSADSSKKDLAGKTFVVTGSLIHYDNRNELKREIESRGGKVSGSVSKNTSYLINNDTESSSSKNKKAKELGIPIVSEEEFLSMN